MPANILLVEGNDDLHVFCNLFQYHNINDTFKVEEKGGFSNILKTIPVYLKGSEITRLGVVLDADDSFQTRWEAVRSCFARENYPMPILPTSDGVIVEVDKRPRIGVWVMPDNAASGTVEDFVTALIPPDDELKIYASDAIECIPSGLKKFGDAKRQKAFIHTWLAWQADPGTPMGLAIRKRYLSPDAQCAEKFVQWVTRLYL